jgi:hypothetical protein
VEGRNPGTGTALKVTLLSLPAPFDLLNGQQLWVQAPFEACEAAAVGLDNPCPAGAPTFRAATLCDQPVFRDWASLGPVQIYHPVIVPGGIYHVEAVCPSLLPENTSDA